MKDVLLVFAVTVSTLPDCRGAGVFQKFYVWGRGQGIVDLQGGCPLKGAPKSRGAEDFDEFFKNVIDKYLKI